MKIYCDFCDSYDTGLKDALMLRGWSRAVFYAPIRKTITACKNHNVEFNRAVNKIFER